MKAVATKRLQLFLKRRALRRISGDLWSACDPFDVENKAPADYYRAYFTDENDKPIAQIMKVDGAVMDVLWWSEENRGFQDEDTVELKTIIANQLRVRRKYYEIQVIYASEAEFFAKDWWYPFTWRLRERLFQRTYQIITPIRAERLSVLAILLDKRFGDNDYEYLFGGETMNTEQIVAQLFGQRVLRRPDVGRIYSRTDLILKSLVESGDIEELDEERFRPLGKAFTTISQAATDDRRHRDITFLTGALVFVGVLGLDWESFFLWASNCFMFLSK